MYAVFAHGGKQYRVAPGDSVLVESVSGEKGAAVEFKDLRMVSEGDDLKLGKALAGLRVLGTLVKQDQGPKVIIFKKKRCKQYRRTRGHRQALSLVRIDSIA